MPALRFLAILLLLCSLKDSMSSSECENVVLRAVQGRDAFLPCGQGKIFLDGKKSFVLWLKQAAVKKYLYRYPNEGTFRLLSIEIEQGLGKIRPCYGDFCRDPTSLHLKRVQKSDEGVYICKVHYQGSPDVEYAVDLRIVDSPERPRIYNANGIGQPYMGKLKLGDNMTLVCELEDVHDKTLLWWERNGVVVERAEKVQNCKLITSIHIQNATRDEFDAHYVCLAQNADVTEPLTASVVIKMNLPPLSIEIRLNNNLNFEAGVPRVVDCVVVGCLPPPTITWHLGKDMLSPSVHKEIHDGNYTISSLTLAPSLRDDYRDLVCRVHDAYLPRRVYEVKVVLSVGFRPTCVNDHEEAVGFFSNQTETVICTVDAYPEPSQFSWIFPDTKTLYTSVKKVHGYPNRYSSSLTWEPKEKDQGELLCRSINALGEQKQPCVFSIVAGGPPPTPDCEFLATYPRTVRMRCNKGWDGGRPQTLHLELQNITGNTLRNITDMYGHFEIPNPEPNLTAIIYASNSRGRSASQVLSLTPMDPTMEINTTVAEVNKPVYAIWTQSIVTTIVIGIIIGIVARFIKAKQRNMGITDTGTNHEEEPTIIIRSDGTFQRQPEVQLNGQSEHPRARVGNGVQSCENQYSLTPMHTYSKVAQLLGRRAFPLPGQRDQLPELDDSERTSYYV